MVPISEGRSGLGEWLGLRDEVSTNGLFCPLMTGGFLFGFTAFVRLLLTLGRVVS
jgi:hypothetical protein